MSVGPPAIPVNDVPARLVRALNAEAKRRNVAVYDVAVEALSASLGFDHVASTRYTRGVTSDKLKLKVTAAVHRAAKVRAAETERTVRRVVLDALTERYL